MKTFTKEINGEYGYYVTVDFPYILQCYRGTPDSSIGMVSGNCGLYGANCNFSSSTGGGGGTGGGNGGPTGGGTGGPGGNGPPGGNGNGPPGGNGNGPPGGNGNGPPGGRKRRTTTEDWFHRSLDFHGGNHPYFQAMFGKERRSRRTVENLTTAIDAYLAGDGQNMPGTFISKETFLRHLAYEVRNLFTADLWSGF